MKFNSQYYQSDTIAEEGCSLLLGYGNTTSTQAIKQTSAASVLLARVRKIAKSDYYFCHVCVSVRPSARLEQLGSHWTDFHETLYLIIF
jgi:hypothetical protein